MKRRNRWTQDSLVGSTAPPQEVDPASTPSNCPSIRSHFGSSHLLNTCQGSRRALSQRLPCSGTSRDHHGRRMPPFVLHESRRYVCRFCTSHLDRVKKELLCRLHSNSKKEPPNNKPPQPKKTPKRGNNLLCNSRGLAGIVKRETGAMNSAMLSVNLVPQQTRVCLSDLVQATGDIPKSPSFGWRRGQVLL